MKEKGYPTKKSWLIAWSPDSKLEYAQILEYLQEKWNPRVVTNFMDDTDDVIEGLKLNPRIYPRLEVNQSLRKAFISKHTSLIYRIENQEIQLLHFWNNSQNPERLKRLIRKY